MSTAFTDQSHVEASRSSARLALPHAIEFEVSRRLQHHPDVKVKTLTVRRTPGGVCLEGRIELSDPNLDLKRVLAGIPGLDEVVNHLVVCGQTSQATPREVTIQAGEC